MKKYAYFSAVAALLTLLVAGPAVAQQRGDDSNRASKNAEATGKIGNTEIRITYGAPLVKGRTIFGGLVPYDQVWRAGANEATTITFSTDVKVNGQDLPAGTYAYFVVPKEDGPWEVIFNKEANQWGAFNYDAEKDALRVTAEPMGADHQETLTFDIQGGDTEGTVVLHWADKMLPLTVTPNS